MEHTKKVWLSTGDLRGEFSLGRDLSTQVIKLLPHIVTGRMGNGPRRLVKREAVEQLLARAGQEDIDLWQLVREHTPETLRAWMDKEADKDREVK